MNFSWLHKKTPENWSTNVLKKIYLGRFRVLEFFSTTRNDRILFSSRALKKYHISINLCILVGYTKKYPKIGGSMSIKKSYLGRFRVLDFFSTTRNYRIFFSSRALKKYYISMNSYFLVGYTRKHPKISGSMS